MGPDVAPLREAPAAAGGMPQAQAQAQAPLPVLVSIPHGGTRTPAELVGRLAASPADILDDSDAFTAEIYGLQRGVDVEEIVAAGVARAFVDPNRPPEDSAPRHPDGSVKSETCFGATLYKEGEEPGAGLTSELIARHHEGYHAALRAALSNPRLRLCVDCHSMAAEAPAGSSPDDAGSRRPAFCLSDGGGTTCPRPMIERLASCVADSFGVGADEVRINDPFAGGYIVRTYGGGGAGAGGSDPPFRRLPWIQIEINRSLYLEGPQPSGGGIGIGIGGRPRRRDFRYSLKDGIFKAVSPRRARRHGHLGRALESWYSPSAGPSAGPSADPARLAALNEMFLGALRAFFR